MLRVPVRAGGAADAETAGTRIEKWAMQNRIRPRREMRWLRSDIADGTQRKDTRCERFVPVVCITTINQGVTRTKSLTS